ncbi:signal peptidase I [Gracilibacillus ureilyticus]|uniref:Signal peptidase I n=1 Tax=Gracilibacillus ureilyticus TaxID=531814 RepID=A0A1H9SM61_9BACI|nr:signal peptidase I [Gracilibacillus ureilyticus]SER86007.1 signal peptidase I [Gracilibacillus ureilyticus]
MKKKKTWSIIRIILFSLLLAFFFRSYLFASYVVNGKSMEPTLHDGNLLMVNKMIYDLKEIDRFDVIVFHANEEEDYVKRVIGLPGDHIAYKNDILYINGEPVKEPYLEPFREEAEGQLTNDFTIEEITEETVVPEGKLFVLGDNRQKSYDSRDIGFVDVATVVGKVDVLYWPMSDIDFQLIR